MRKPDLAPPPKQTSETSRKITMGLVGACVMLVLMNLLASAVFSREAIAKRTMEGLAREYYENFYFGKLSEEVKVEHAENGLPPVSLRSLLNYDISKLSEEIHFKRVACDVIDTYVTYYPVAPYGPSDYAMDIHYSCKFR